MECGADCLRDWPFGAAGVCDNVTSLCICPDGYFGKDDWREYNDCHVHKELAHAVHLTMMSFNFLVILGHLVGFCLTRPHFDNIFHLKRTVVKSTMRLLRPPRHERHEIGGFDPIHEDDKWRLDKAVLVTVYCLFLYPYITLFYVVPMGLGQYPYEVPILLDFGRGVATALVLISYILINYIWYLSLPNLAMLGQMHGVSTLLIKYPRLVAFVVYTSVVVVAVAVVGLTIVLPATYPEDLELRRVTDAWFTYIVFIVWTATTVFLLILRILLRNLLKELQTTFASMFDESMDFSLRHATRTVNAWSRLSCVILIPAALMTGLAAFTEFGKRHIFLLFSATSIVTGLAGCLYVVALYKTFQNHRSTSLSHRKSSHPRTTVSYNPHNHRNGSLSNLNSSIVIHDI